MANGSMGLLQGTVDVLILKTLSSKPLHGYAISEVIHERSNGDLAVEDAALYQALHRLERKGFVESEWGISDTNRRARFYSISTANGAATIISHLNTSFSGLTLVRPVLTSSTLMLMFGSSKGNGRAHRN